MSSVCNYLQPVSFASIRSRVQSERLKISTYANFRLGRRQPKLHLRSVKVTSSKLNPWDEPTPLTYSPVDEADQEISDASPGIFTSLESDERITLAEQNSEETTTETGNKQQARLFVFFRWPLWLLGPSLLLVTGMVPTLWLPFSAVFVGPNIASLLSLTGLDCIFNLGATLFLLMAHSCALPNETLQTKKEAAYNGKAPKSYQFWNILASIVGYAVPLFMLLTSKKGIIQPELSPISFLVLFGPYLLLLSVQILTEMLTWLWRSPVWLITPVVYEIYRVLQLMRSLKLGLELGVPGWTVDSLRGLVCWWVVMLGIQLMRVAWFAGFSTRSPQQQGSSAGRSRS